jgi:hypothetical protein
MKRFYNNGIFDEKIQKPIFVCGSQYFSIVDYSDIGKWMKSKFPITNIIEDSIIDIEFHLP